MNLPDSDHDLLTRFLLPHAGVRGVHVRLHGSWQELLSHASYPPAATRLLGEACAAAAMLTAHVKVEGRLSLQLRADAQLKLLFAECTAAGTVRGIAQLEDGSDAPADLQRLVNPVLAITIENPSLGGREPIRYQGLVELDADNLAEAFEGYFRQSEQLPTRLLLACDGQRAAGLMLQKLPGDAGDGDGWSRAGALFDTLGIEELLALPPAEAIHRLFHEESPEAMGEKPLRFACSCSRERVAAMLVSLGAGEAGAAVEAGDGEARVRCEFCGQEYCFDGDQVAGLFRDAAAELPAAPHLH